ncbi:MAG: hypothetical protein MI742_11970, partial [Desulfobacterales bacterium]|nr:hypothetical protein [Desulfobacterales bacterium]
NDITTPQNESFSIESQNLYDGLKVSLCATPTIGGCVTSVTEDLIHRQYEKIDKIRTVYEMMQKEIWEATGRESKPYSEKGCLAMNRLTNQ